MRKEILLTLFSLIALTLMSQEKNIEVEIRDTIMCKIDVINYMLTVEEEPGHKLIENYLRENNISNKKMSHSRLKTYNVRFNSWDEVEKLKTKLEGESIKAHGIGLGNEHKLTDSEIDKLYKKILKRSKEEASNIAKAMGKQLGEVIEVRYNSRESTKGSWTAYPPFSNMSDPTIELPEEKNEEMVKSKSLIVKYKFK